jgi:hypothetical protein
MILRSTLWMPAAALALLSLGCSDPAPTPAAVGLTLSVHSPNTPIADSVCGGLGSSAIGNPPPTLNPISPGTRITDGKSSVEVGCAVKGSSTFSVNASITQGATNFNISAGTIDKATGAGTFNVTMYTPYSDNLASEDRPCTFDASEPPLEVTPGNLFARFDCPALYNRENAAVTACGADGILVLEFCEE